VWYGNVATTLERRRAAVRSIPGQNWKREKGISLKNARPIYTLKESGWAFCFGNCFFLTHEAIMRSKYRNRIQALMILFFTTLPLSVLVAQFKSDLRQQLYPPFVQNELSRPEFNWYEQQSTPADSNVTLLGRWAWGECFAVASKDNFVYVGNGSVLQIFDAFDTAPSKIVTELLMDGVVKDIQISDNLAYILAGGDLVIFDLTVPFQPRQLGKVELFRGPTRFCVAGNYCYVISFDTLFIVDVSQPDRPTLVSSIPAGGENPTDVIAVGDFVYVGHEAVLSFMIVDVSDPVNPQWFDAYSGIGTPNTFTLFGNYLLVGGLSFRILDISQPTNPVRIAGLLIGRWITGIAVKDSCAFVSVADSGLFVIDISRIDAPKQIGFVTRKGIDISSRGLSSVSNYVYAAWYTGLWILDISDKTRPQERYFFPTGNWAHDVAVDGQYLYVADGRAGLWILDVSAPSSPKPIANLDTKDFAAQVEVHKNLAYVVTSELLVIDVSNPYSPKILSHYQGFIHETYTGWINRIAVSDSFVFITQYDNGLEIVDVKNPYAPRAVGHFLQSMIVDVAVAGGYAYLGTLEKGMRVVDVRDPFQLREVGYFQRPNVSVVRLKTVDSIVYLDEGTAIRILDVSNLSHLEELSYLSLQFGLLDIEVKERYLYVPGVVIDVSSPRVPRVVGHYLQRSPARGIATDGKNIFVAATENGVYVWRNDLVSNVPPNRERTVPEDFLLLPNAPNPFNASTQISFYLASKVSVNLEIFNISGQCVQSLGVGVQNRGKHTITFDATDLPNGIYFCRLRVGKHSQQIKMLLLR
jgi:hypothetical protein